MKDNLYYVIVARKGFDVLAEAAIAYIHSKSIMHRDIKVGNLHGCERLSPALAEMTELEVIQWQ